MVIPERIKILFKEYQIEQREGLHDGADDLYGQICYFDEKILLNSSCSEDQKKATLIHEIVHGLDEMYGIDLKEKQVEKLGNAFYMLLLCIHPDGQHSRFRQVPQQACQYH